MLHIKSWPGWQPVQADGQARVAQTITPGQAVRAQLAKMCNGPREAFDMMAGRDFFVEAKYDGARCCDLRAASARFQLLRLTGPCVLYRLATSDNVFGL